MTQLLVGVGIAYILAITYHNGRKDGNQSGWSAAWHRARKKFQRRHRRGNAAQ